MEQKKKDGEVRKVYDFDRRDWFSSCLNSQHIEFLFCLFFSYLWAQSFHYNLNLNQF